MSNLSKKTTIYLEPQTLKALKFKSARLKISVSELVNETMKTEINEDAEDLEAFAERENDEFVPFEEFVTQLKKDGKI